MSVSFDSRRQLLDWNGEQWCHQTFPTSFASRKPPRPASMSAASINGGRTNDSSMSQPKPRPALPVSITSPTSHSLAVLLAKGLEFRGDPKMTKSVAQALLECHYCVHGAFLCQLTAALGLSDIDCASSRSDCGLRHHDKGTSGHNANVLEYAHMLRHIPTIAVQGQMDMVCPPTTALELHAVWPEMQLRFVPGAGHSMYDTAITHELVEATLLMHGVITES